MLVLLALWTMSSLIVFRMQRRALRDMQTSEAIPFSAGSVLFSCALMGLVLALGTMVFGTFVWHHVLA